MTEDQNDQTNQGPRATPIRRPLRAVVPETTSQAAIPLPGRDSPGLGAAPSAPPAARHPPDGRCARPDATVPARPRRRAPTPWAPSPATRCWVPRRHPPSALLRPPTPAPPRGRRLRRRDAPRPARATTASATACWLEPPPSRSWVPASASAMPRSNNGEQHAGLQPDLGQLAAPSSSGSQAAQLLRGFRLLGESLRQHSPFGGCSATPEAPATRAAAARVLELLGSERRQRHRLQGRPWPRRHQHDARLPAGAGRRHGHRALVQRRHPDQQPRDRRGHQHQRDRRRQQQDLHGQRRGLRPDQGHRGPAAAQRLGPADGDPRQLVQRLSRRGRRRRRKRRRHRRHPERGRRHRDGAEPVHHRQ